METYREAINERIRRLRLVREKYLKDNNCEEERFCKLVDIPYIGILKEIESSTNEKYLNNDRMKKIADILGVSMTYLVSGTKTAEDMARPEVLFLSQIGSMIHGRRIALKSGTKDKRKWFLLHAATRLGISSMELKRIEDLYKSALLEDKKILKKVNDVLGIPLKDLEESLKVSFPRGDERQKVLDRGKELLVCLVDSSGVIRQNKFPAEISDRKYEKLLKRIEIELTLLK